MMEKHQISMYFSSCTISVGDKGTVEVVRPESGTFYSSVLFEYEVIEMGRVLLLKDRLSPNEEEDMVDDEHDEEIDEEMQVNDDEPSEQQLRLVGDDACDAGGVSDGY